MKETLWYRAGNGLTFHVERGGLAELQLRKDGAQVIPDPTDPDAEHSAPNTDNTPTPPGPDGLDEASFAQLKELAQARPGFEFKVGMSKSDLITFLQTGTAGTPGDGQ